MFRLFAELIVSVVAWVFGSNFDSYLIAHLFKTITKHRGNQTNQYDPALRQISKQEPPRFKWFQVCIRDKRSLIMRKQGQETIAKQTDIIRFIRRQLMYEIALKNLFTRVELFLMKN